MKPSEQAADNLPRLRSWHRVNQTDTAKLIDAHQTTIMKIERGHRRLSLDEAFILADRFGLTVDEFCTCKWRDPRDEFPEAT